MRTTKRFTPGVLDRFERQGRGTGTYEKYIGWHRVTRGDPSSQGRSHLMNWKGRLRDLLSDGELAQQLFAAMIPDLEDCLEQCLLSLHDSIHLLANYELGHRELEFPGTLKLCKELGIKHPQVTDAGGSAEWRPTTDLVLVIKPATGRRELLALAFKPAGWKGTKRQWQLLMLEREYWVRRSATWLLISPALYEQATVLTLRRSACWALADEVPENIRSQAAKVCAQESSRSQTALLKMLEGFFGSMEIAQRAVWQAIWRGELPVDLRRSWRPHVPFSHVTPGQFRDLNPISSRKSAWI